MNSEFCNANDMERFSEVAAGPPVHVSLNATSQHMLDAVTAGSVLFQAVAECGKNDEYCRKFLASIEKMAGIVEDVYLNNGGQEMPEDAKMGRIAISHSDASILASSLLEFNELRQSSAISVFCEKQWENEISDCELLLGVVRDITRGYEHAQS